MKFNNYAVITLLCLFFLFENIFAQNIPWPTNTDETHNTNRIIGNIGEYRGNNRFHSGIDFSQDHGRQVYAITTGEITHIRGSGNNVEVVVEDDQGNTVEYTHITRCNTCQVGDNVDVGDLLGTMVTQDNIHLHLEYPDNILDDLSNFIDNGAPVWQNTSLPNGIRFNRNGLTHNGGQVILNTQYQNRTILYNKIDVEMHARDYRIEEGGGIPPPPNEGQLAPYEIRMTLEDESGSALNTMEYRFTTIPENDAAEFCFGPDANHPGDQNVHIITAHPYTMPYDRYFNTKQEQEYNQTWPASNTNAYSDQDANSNDEAEYPDGNYIFHFDARDIDSDATLNRIDRHDDVCFDNFMPYIKTIDIYRGGARLLTKNWVVDEDGIITFSESGPSDGPPSAENNLSIVVMTSEAVEDLMMTFESCTATSNEIGQSSDNKTWMFQFPLTDEQANCEFEHCMTFSARDCGGNNLLPLTEEDRVQLPSRDANGTFTPAIAGNAVPYCFELIEACAANGGRFSNGFQANILHCVTVDFDYEIEHFGNAVQFEDLSGPNMDIKKWRWDFGDDSGVLVDERPKLPDGRYDWGKEVESNPLHTYEFPDGYTDSRICYDATLEIEYGIDESKDITKQVCFPITPHEGTFSAVFLTPSECPVYIDIFEEVKFEAVAVGGVPPYEYNWSRTDIQEEGPGPHWFDFLDNGTVSVTVTDAQRSSIALSCDVFVERDEDELAIKIRPLTAEKGQPVGLKADYNVFAIADYLGVNTTQLSRQWRFRDDTYDDNGWQDSPTDNITHTFQTEGGHIVSFRVCERNNDSNCKQVTETIAVAGDPIIDDPDARMGPIQYGTPGRWGPINSPIPIRIGETSKQLFSMRMVTPEDPMDRVCSTSLWYKNGTSSEELTRLIPDEGWTQSAGYRWHQEFHWDYTTAEFTPAPFVDNFSTSSSVHDCIDLTVDTKYQKCSATELMNPPRIYAYKSCAFKIVPYPIKITELISISNDCSPVLSVQAEDGYRHLEDSGLAGACNEETFYSVYAWVAKEVGGDNRLINGLFTHPNRKCTEINFDHPYFERFGLDESRRFIIEVTVTDERDHQATHTQLISLAPPVYFTLLNEMDMCKSDDPKSISLRPIAAGGEGDIFINCIEGDCNLVDLTDPLYPKVSFEGKAIGDAINVKLRAKDSSQPICTTEDFDLKINVTDGLDFYLFNRVTMAECKGDPDQNITAESRKEIGPNNIDGSGTYTYIWTSDSPTYGVSLLDDSYSKRTNVRLPPDNSSITYTITVRDELSGCEKSKSVTVDKTDDLQLAIDISPEHSINCYQEDHFFEGFWSLDHQTSHNARWSWTSNHPNFNIIEGSALLAGDYGVKSGTEQLFISKDVTKVAGDYQLSFEIEHRTCVLKKTVDFTILPEWEYHGFENTVEFVPDFPHLIDTWNSEDNLVVHGPKEPVSYTYYNADNPHDPPTQFLPPTSGLKFMADENRKQLQLVVTDAIGCKKEFLSNRAQKITLDEDGRIVGDIEIRVLGENGSDYFCDMGNCIKGGKACFDVSVFVEIPIEDVGILRKIQVVHQYSYLGNFGPVYSEHHVEDFEYFSYDYSLRQAIYKKKICYPIHRCTNGEGVPYSLNGNNFIYINALLNSNYDPELSNHPELYLHSKPREHLRAYKRFHVDGRPKCGSNHPLLEFCDCLYDAKDCNDCDYTNLTYNPNKSTYIALQNCEDDFSTTEVGSDLAFGAEQSSSSMMNEQRSDAQGKAYGSTASGAFLSGSAANGSENTNIQEIFVLKQDLNDETTWEKYFNATEGGIANTLATDGAENVSIAGYFKGDLDFDGMVLSSNSQAIFVAQLDVNGSVRWAKQAGSTSENETALSSTVDNSGNTYISGYVSGNASFDGINTNTPINRRSFFIAKYDPNGIVQWVKTGTSDRDIRASVIASDDNGNLYAAGNFTGTLSLAGANPIVGSGFEESAFLAKYNTDGSIAWTKQIGAGSNVQLVDMVVDNSGQVTVAGTFDGTSSFDGGQNLTSRGGTDLFFERFTTQGTQTDLTHKGGSQDEQIHALATDEAGQYVYAGTVADQDGTLNCDVDDKDNCEYYFETEIVHASCDSDNGAIFINNLAFADQLNFEWYDANELLIAGTKDITGLAAGSYTLKIINAAACEKTFDFSVVGGTLSVVLNVEQPSCGLENGNIYASASGGQAPYSFAWSNNSADQDLIGVGSGTYTLTLTDADGCEWTESTTLDGGTALTLAITSTDTECGKMQGSVQVIASGGTPPYSYTWNDIAENIANRTGLNAGIYSVTVTDDVGCTADGFASVEHTTMPDVEGEVDDIVCFGFDGAIRLTLDGVSGEFAAVATVESNEQLRRGRTDELLASEQIDLVTGFDAMLGSEFDARIAPQDDWYFNWSNGENTRNIDHLRYGRYAVTISNDEGCQLIKSFEVKLVPQFDIEGLVTDASCGEYNGRIDLTITNGTAPFTYNWSNGASTQNIKDLSVGTYAVTVIDANDCILSKEFRVGMANDLVLSASVEAAVCGQANGTINLTITGGQLPYDIDWDNDEVGADDTTPDTKDLSDLAAGFYSVTVVDAGGCSRTASFEVEDDSSNPPVVSYGDIIHHCNQDGGVLDVHVEGDEADFTYEWRKIKKGETNREAGTLVSTDKTADIREKGLFKVFVTDSRGCFSTPKGAKTLYHKLTIDPYCIDADPEYDVRSRKKGGSSKIDFSWTKDGNILTDKEEGYLSGQSEGIYCVTVTDVRTNCPSLSGIVNVSEDCGSGASAAHSESLYYDDQVSGLSIEVHSQNLEYAIDLSIKSPLTERIEIQLLDAQGAQIYQEFLELLVGQNNLSIDISHLDIPSGIYQLLFMPEDGITQRFRLLKLE